MQNLGEQMCPEDFEPKTEEACAHGDEPQPPKLCGWNRVFQRRLFLRCCFLAIADQDCNESSGQAGASRNAIACTHADKDGKAKAGGGCTKHTAHGVDRVQQAATSFNRVDAGESLTESWERCAQA